MRRILLAVVIPLFLLSCGRSDKTNTIVSGTAPGYKGEMLYLQTITSSKLLLSDSAVVDSLGNFTFRLSLSVPEFLAVSADAHKKGSLFIASPSEQIELLVPRSGGLDAMVVKGSSGSMLISQMKDSLKYLRQHIEEYDVEFDTLRYDYTYDSLRRDIKQRYADDLTHYRNFLRRLIKHNFNSIASLVALYQKFDTSGYVLDQHADLKYFLLVDSSLYKRYSGNSVVKAFHKSMGEIRTQLNNQKLGKESVSEGHQAPNFVTETIYGDTLNLARYYGRFVLLNFWAPWAKSSVEANRNLPEVYAKYKPYGFEIIQVSLARTPSEQSKAMTSEMEAWKHVAEYKIWNSSLAKEYGIAVIPSNILIDRQGKVVAKNVFGKNLYDTLRWYLVRPYLLKQEMMNKTE